MVVEAAARCLNVIQPGLNIPPKLPPSMSARYKLGTLIAEACIVSISVVHVPIGKMLPNFECFKVIL